MKAYGKNLIRLSSILLLGIAGVTSFLLLVTGEWGFDILVSAVFYLFLGVAGLYHSNKPESYKLLKILAVVGMVGGAMAVIWMNEDMPNLICFVCVPACIPFLVGASRNKKGVKEYFDRIREQEEACPYLIEVGD